MAFTNYGNGYKFQAMMKRHHTEPEKVMLQRMKKNGEWGKPLPTAKLRNSETAEEVLERIREYNPNNVWRLAED